MGLDIEKYINQYSGLERLKVIADMRLGERSEAAARVINKREKRVAELGLIVGIDTKTQTTKKGQHLLPL